MSGLEGFTPLTVKLDGDGAFADVEAPWQGGRITEVAALAGGTRRGKPSVALRIECNDGSTVIAETTWNLLYSACRAIEARYGPSS